MTEQEHTITSENEKRTLIIIVLTIITMVAEIVYGYITNSMSLLADGYHMGTHALAIGLTYVAYLLTRKFKNSDKFKNGTDKIGVLAAYTSSLILGSTGVWIIFESFKRCITPLNINFNDAILVAVIGLIVNAVCIAILEYKNCNHKESKDYNFLAAYYHILADALTSGLAIIALLIGKYFNIVIFDPIIGILGGVLILQWAINLIKNTVKVLVDIN